MNSETNKPMSCGDNFGTMPSCAPLAVPFVPFQQNNPMKYSHEEALSNGTLFPGLNLPFHVKTNAVSVGNSALAELQALEFVVAELALYMDTHSNDAEAFALFQQYAALEKEGRQRYEELYGPLTQSGAANADSYTWYQGPWPWEYGEGGAK